MPGRPQRRKTMENCQMQLKFRLCSRTVPFLERVLSTSLALGGGSKQVWFESFISTSADPNWCKICDRRYQKTSKNDPKTMKSQDTWLARRCARARCKRPFKGLSRGSLNWGSSWLSQSVISLWEHELDTKVTKDYDYNTLTVLQAMCHMCHMRQE